MDELDLIDLFLSECFVNNLLDLFTEKNHKKIIIECGTPEIGTKIENIEENNIQINQKRKNDYYNNEYKEILFYPFFNMDKDKKKTDTKYHLVYYYEDDIYNLYILKDSKEEEIKIQINNKSIIRIMYNISNNIELFIYLKTVPKVYTKESNILKASFFFERFKYNI